MVGVELWQDRWTDNQMDEWISRWMALISKDLFVNLHKAQVQFSYIWRL